MMLETGLYAYLMTQSGLTAKIGDRLYPLLAPPNVALPYVVYSQVDARPSHAMDDAAGLATARYQFDIYAPRVLTGKEIAAALREALDGFRGMWGTVAVGAVLWLNDVDLMEPESVVTRIASDYDITWSV